MQTHEFKQKHHLEAIHALLKELNIEYSNIDDLNTLTPAEDLAYYYLIYKENYTPWRERTNYARYMAVFKDIFNKTYRKPCLNSINEIMISLTIIFYFDTIIHN